MTRCAGEASMTLQPGITLFRHIRHHWTASLEFSLMMLEYRRFWRGSSDWGA